MTMQMPAHDRLRAEQEALENCETEPIAFIGSVQRIGWLVATDVVDLEIKFVSENVTTHIGREPASLLGSPVSSLFASSTLHRIRNVLGHPTISTQREFVDVVVADGKEFDLSVHQSGDHAIFELVPVAADPVAAQRNFAKAQVLLRSVNDVENLQSLLEQAVGHLRALTGFDRVKAYRFLPDGAGQVVAESKRFDVDSFLGLRFPAFDIPQAARAIYTKTPIRHLSDISAERCAIVGTADATDLDLSLAFLRGSPAVHLQYLTNMGVRTTMSLPIVVDGELWGLFALHHKEALTIDFSLLSACEFAGQGLSLAIQHQQQREHRQLVQAAGSAAASLAAVGVHPLGIASYWDSLAADCRELVACDGLSLIAGGEAFTEGSTPDPEVTQRIVDHMHAQRSGATGSRNIVALSSMSSLDVETDASPVAGFMAIDAPTPGIDVIIFYRDESVAGIKWAGAATKNLVEEEETYRLHPRGSFSEYIEKAAGTCDDWSNLDLSVVEALRDALIIAAAATNLADQQQQQLGLLVRELNHRVRNILALVQSMIGQSRVDGREIEAYIESLERRIVALAGAHHLLTENEWSELPLAAVLSKTLQPYMHDVGEGGVALDGPEHVLVQPALASLLSMVSHELASNAAKYGALSVSDGRVVVQWYAQPDHLVIEWTEAGGPTVVAPTSRGFGSSIIEGALAFEFDADVEVTFDPEGVRVRFDIPGDFSGSAAVGRSIPAPSAESTDPQSVLLGGSVLVVEDNFLISEELRGMLEELGVTSVKVAASVEQALAVLAGTGGTEPIRFAVLDADLRGDSSGPVADELQRLGLPFFFATGYGSSDRDLAGWDVPVLTKPINVESLSRAIEEVI